MTLNEYLLLRFNRSNHPKYRKYAIEWSHNIDECSVMYCESVTIKLK